MKKLLITTVLLFISVTAYSDVYVSTTGNDTTGDGSIGNPYRTIQKGIDALTIQGPSNTLYLRGGTYTTIPTDGTYRGFDVSAWTGGDSWSNAYTIRSYPGEWAVIDGSNYTGEATFIGIQGIKSCSDVGRDDFACQRYVEFSNFEIKNCNSTSRGYGLFMRGGPYKFRYLSIHDNNCDIPNNNPAGLGGYMGQTTIEYCDIQRNGYIGTDSQENSSNLVLFSDYQFLSWEGTNPELNQYLTNPDGIAQSINDVIIRYNYFDGGDQTNKTSIGIKIKGQQYLMGCADTTLWGSPLVDTNNWKDKGLVIHHNIFENHIRNAIVNQADFAQIYNNICDSPADAIKEVIEHGVNDLERGPSHGVLYNNTLQNGLSAGINYTNRPDGSHTLYTTMYSYNNIIDNNQTYDNGRAITATRYPRYVDVTWDTDNLLEVKNNFFYRPDNTLLARILEDTFTLSEMNLALWGSANDSDSYNVSDYLYVGTTGADKYKLNPAYSKYSTVSAGGIGGNHPYLTGVTLPSYVGAVNPDDNSWVDGVLNDITSTTYLESASDDPTWIEGAEAPVTTTPTLSGFSLSGVDIGG